MKSRRVRSFHFSLKRLKIEKIMRIDARHVHKTDDRPGPSPHLQKAAFNDVGGAQRRIGPACLSSKSDYFAKSATCRTKRRRSARMTHLCSAKVIHTKNRIWRSASACQHHHPRRRRVSLSSGEGESAWRTDVTPGVAFGAGQNGCFCPPPVGHFSRANHGNFSRVPKDLSRKPKTVVI